MIMIIVGAIAAIILSLIAIFAFAAILELFKFVAVAGVILFSFLWLSVFIKKKFELDKNVSMILGGIISVILGVSFIIIVRVNILLVIFVTSFTTEGFVPKASPPA